eukprot:5002-Heterococcus_DN1.PRE.4
MSLTAAVQLVITVTASAHYQQFTCNSSENGCEGTTAHLQLCAGWMTPSKYTPQLQSGMSFHRASLPAIADAARASDRAAAWRMYFTPRCAEHWDAD